jgi:hypothetical protein
LDRIGAIKRVDVADVLLVANQAALRRVERLGAAVVAAIVAAPLAIDIVSRVAGLLHVTKYAARFREYRSSPALTLSCCPRLPTIAQSR